VCVCVCVCVLFGMISGGSPDMHACVASSPAAAISASLKDKGDGDGSIGSVSQQVPGLDCFHDNHHHQYNHQQHNQQQFINVHAFICG